MLQEALSALTRIYSQLNIASKISNSHSAVKLKLNKKSPPNITFKNVNFSYTNKIKALDNINFFIEAGTKVALVGQSGAGKSSIVNLISRFYDPLSGEIFINQQSLKNINLNSLRDNVALVSQDTVIYNKTFLENIRFGNLDANDDDIIKAAKNAGIHEFIKTTHDSYNTLLGEGGKNLSGGQRQRISIARAILKDAPILLLDEATSALDTKTEDEVNKALEKLTKNKTTITVAHKLSNIVNFDQIILFNKGKIVGLGKHQDLVKKSSLYRKLYKLNINNV